MLVDVYNKEAEVVGQVELPGRIFGCSWRPDLVYQAFQAQLKNRRQPLAHAKARSEVRGGGRKPWRQKHTGRARHGSIRSPIWIGGGVTHGPTKERKYKVKLNKKMRQGAIFTVLSRKMKDKEIKIIDALNIEQPKTKLAAGLLKKFFDRRQSILIVPSSQSKNISQASANLFKTKVINPKSLNVEGLLRHKYILLDKEAIKIIDEHYHAV